MIWQVFFLYTSMLCKTGDLRVLLGIKVRRYTLQQCACDCPCVNHELQNTYIKQLCCCSECVCVWWGGDYWGFYQQMIRDNTSECSVICCFVFRALWKS